jgi:type VI secretion system protein VasI
MRKLIFYSVLLLIVVSVWTTIQRGTSSAPQVAAVTAASKPAPFVASPTPTSGPPTNSSEPSSSSSVEAKPEPPIRPVFWYERSDTSQMDDSKTVWVSLQSEDTIEGRYGDTTRAELLIRCFEHKTALTLQLGDHFMADVEGYGTVTYRIDNRKAATRHFQESTDNSVLGLWDGGSSIPFIKSLFDAEKLVMRAIPFNESAIDVSFDIYGTKDAVKNVRKACGW